MINEYKIRTKFYTIYEILDEILDFGYPQNTEFNSLKLYVDSKGGLPNSSSSNSNSNNNNGNGNSIIGNNKIKKQASMITNQATSAISWRRPDIKYRKNEAFLDVLEEVNLLIGSNGSVLTSYVSGHIQMKTHLSGMPECKFGLNDSLSVGSSIEGHLADYDVKNKKAIPKAAAGEVVLEDCQFHQCVKLGQFDQDRTISFIPPDGEFELMKYRTTENINLPFRIYPQIVEIGKTKVEYNISIRALYSSKLYATDVIINIPVPDNSIKTNHSVTSGKAKYDPSEHQIVWKFARFIGGGEYTFKAEVELSSYNNNNNNNPGNNTGTMINSSRNGNRKGQDGKSQSWNRTPISIKFNLLMFSCSGLVVRFLKIFEKSGYNTVKWVRYIAKAGSYEVRY